MEAAKKKHEAIQTDIKAYESRVKTVVDMANSLETEQYWGIDRIKEDLDKVRRLKCRERYLRYYIAGSSHCNIFL